MTLLFRCSFVVLSMAVCTLSAEAYHCSARYENEQGEREINFQVDPDHSDQSQRYLLDQSNLFRASLVDCETRPPETSRTHLVCRSYDWSGGNFHGTYQREMQFGGRFQSFSDTVESKQSRTINRTGCINPNLPVPTPGSREFQCRLHMGPRLRIMSLSEASSEPQRIDIGYWFGNFAYVECGINGTDVQCRYTITGNDGSQTILQRTVSVDVNTRVFAFAGQGLMGTYKVSCQQL